MRHLIFMTRLEEIKARVQSGMMPLDIPSIAKSDLCWLINMVEKQAKALGEARDILALGAKGPSIKWRAIKWDEKWKELMEETHGDT